MRGRLEPAWATRGGASTALLPLAWLYGGVTALRRRLYRDRWLATHHVPVPVIVVGNLLVGGVGKTPAVIAVCELLRAAGRVPGIVSRGYGRSAPATSGSDVLEVDAATPVATGGDEPVLLRRRTGAPVVVGRDRVAAAHALLQRHFAVNVIVSDDGLQHLALGRDIEIVVFDERGEGNGRLLPAGPLREPVVMPRERAEADNAEPRRIVLYNATRATTSLPGFIGTRHLAGVASLEAWRRGEPPSADALASLRGRRVVAAAGIGRPERFFAMLRESGLQIEPLPLPDHHDYAVLPWPSTAGDVVITEKDAVKIDPARRIVARMWVATLDFQPEPAFASALLAALPPVPPAPEPTADLDGNTPA